MKTASEPLSVGLSSWIIADGNYEHFKCGDKASFALAFYAPNSAFGEPENWLSINPDANAPLMRHLHGSNYLITAKVAHVIHRDEFWWVIDAGAPMYKQGKPPEGITEGCWVTGEIYLGIDCFLYFERLSRHHAAPPLIFDWKIGTIEVDISPIITTGRMNVRDTTRRAWREVQSTREHGTGICDEFVLHCVRQPGDPRR